MVDWLLSASSRPGKATLAKVAFGSIMMASSAMNNLFVTFYRESIASLSLAFES